MTNAKVTVTKEVAEAIESIKSGYNGRAYNIDTIFSNARHTPESDYGTIYRWIKRDNDINGVHEYFSALVNGYEIAKTPEDKVREYYERCVANRNQASAENRTFLMNGYDGQATGASITLDILGIKISGVNA